MLRRSSILKKGHLIITAFDAYQHGALTESETAVFHQHLESCGLCQAQLDDHSKIAQWLRSENRPTAILSPAAAARIQQNISRRMRRALIMNSIKSYVGATAAFVVLAVVVGFFLGQFRTNTAARLVDPAELTTRAEVQVTPSLEPDTPAPTDVPPSATVPPASPTAEPPTSTPTQEPTAVVEETQVTSPEDIIGRWLTTKPNRNFTISFSAQGSFVGRFFEGGSSGTYYFEGDKLVIDSPECRKWDPEAFEYVFGDPCTAYYYVYITKDGDKVVQLRFQSIDDPDPTRRGDLADSWVPDD